MDTSDTVRLISGAVLIAVGVPLFFLAKYLLASEENKKRIARSLKIVGMIWMSVGVILYLVTFLIDIF
jgi:uncharacterized protein YjeT (DUF2065 family)